MIDKIDVPLLIISGENDVFALPKYAKRLYKKATSTDKTIAIIRNARHSHVRYDNKYEFDYVVSNFLLKVEISERMNRFNNFSVVLTLFGSL